MNRIVIAAALGLLALGAGGVWALGQFGQTSSVASIARPPLVQEPEIVAAAAPTKPATPNGDAGLKSQPAPSKPPAKPVPKPADKPAATPAPADKPAAAPAVESPAAPPNEATVTPQSTPTTPADPLQTAANDLAKQLPKLPENPLDLFKDKPDRSLFRSNLEAPGGDAPTSPEAPAEPQAQPQGEPTVQVQSAPASQPAPPTVTAEAKPQASKPKADPTVQTQSVSSTTTQTPPPSGLEAQFKARRITYNRPPEKLALDKPVDVSLVINATQDTDAGKEALQGFKGEVVERDVDLSDTVSAQLTGVGFDITSQTVERQRLSGKVLNRWQWRVTPTEVGPHELTLAIFGYESGALDAEPLGAYTDRIVVEVEQLDQIVTWAKGVQPIFAVLAALAAVGSACFAFLRFREEKKQTKVMSSRGE